MEQKIQKTQSPQSSIQTFNSNIHDLVIEVLNQNRDLTNNKFEKLLNEYKIDNLNIIINQLLTWCLNEYEINQETGKNSIKILLKDMVLLGMELSKLEPQKLDTTLRQLNRLSPEFNL